jgi:hypothetical protein
VNQFPCQACRKQDDRARYRALAGDVPLYVAGKPPMRGGVLLRQLMERYGEGGYADDD